MLQYKMLELGMDKELKNIQNAQEEIEAMKKEVAGEEDGEKEQEQDSQDDQKKDE